MVLAQDQHAFGEDEQGSMKKVLRLSNLVQPTVMGWENRSGTGLQPSFDKKQTVPSHPKTKSKQQQQKRPSPASARVKRTLWSHLCPAEGALGLRILERWGLPFLWGMPQQSGSHGIPRGGGGNFHHLSQWSLYPLWNGNGWVQASALISW